MKALDQVLSSLVEERWKEHKRVVYASTAGTLLGKSFNLTADLKGMKLVPYVQTNLGNVLQVVHHPNTQVPAFAPKSATLPLKIDDLINIFAPVSASPVVEEHEISPRFRPTVWRAFGKPITPDTRRALALQPNLRYFELSLASTLPQGTIEIPQQLIVPPNSADPVDRNARLTANILKWAGDNNVDRTLITVGDVERSASTLLDRLLSSLDDAELRSVTLSLQVVKKLRDTQSR